MKARNTMSSMTQFHKIALAVVAVALLAPISASAQELAADSQAAALCTYSRPVESDDESASARNKERRKLLHKRFTVTVTAEDAPVIGYDDVTGILSVNAYRPLPISEHHAVVLDGAGALPFEVTAERSNDVISHYVTGQARLRLEFVPAAFADAEQPICTRADSQEPTPHLIHAALLKASLIDPLGRTLVSFETALGREADLLVANNIAGFLASAYPQVTVASIRYFDGKPSYPRTSPEMDEALERKLTRLIQKRLYGCYVRGLASNGRLQGALVVRFDTVGEAEATVLVDSLNSPPVAGCVVERLGEVGALVGTETAEKKQLKATLIFRLEDNSL